MTAAESDFINQLLNETLQSDCHMRHLDSLQFHKSLKVYSLKNSDGEEIQFPANWIFFRQLFKTNSEIRIDKSNHRHLYDVLINFLNLDCTAFIFRSTAQDRVSVYVAGVKSKIKKAA